MLTAINIVQFKSHIATNYTFTNKIIAFVGNNGSGKTNILDAIYYSCFARSYFTKTDKNLPTINCQGFRINGNFTHNNLLSTYTCICREDGKKELYLNEEFIKKTSQYIGQNTCVMIAPDDIDIINGGSEIRRKYIDILLCQCNKQYILQLQTYNKILLQRNALLKTINETKQQNTTLLTVLNEQLVAAAKYIYNTRVACTIQLFELINTNYNYIADHTDAVQLQYTSQLQHNELEQLLILNLQKDIVTQRTNAGIHKDDLLFSLHNETFKNIASQGQKKSLLLALKLAEYNYLTIHNTASTPLLLLDDIFERLDNIRIQKLFELITTQLKCQVFITDTDSVRVAANIERFTNNFYIIKL